MTGEEFNQRRADGYWMFMNPRGYTEGGPWNWYVPWSQDGFNVEDGATFIGIVLSNCLVLRFESEFDAYRGIWLRTKPDWNWVIPTKSYVEPLYDGDP